MSRRLRLVIAGVCAAAAVVLCLLYGQSIEAEAESERTEVLERFGGEVVSIVVASEDLSVGDVISEDNVSEEEWVSDLAPVDAITSMDDVIGLEITIPLSEGVPLTTLNFQDVEDAVEVPEGRVAISVEYDDDLGLTSAVAEGDRLIAYQVDDSGVQLLSEDVLVIDLPSDSSGTFSSGTVTLAVLPEDVTDLLYASTEGTLRLVLPAEDVSELDDGTVVAPTEVDPITDEDADESTDEVVDESSDQETNESAETVEEGSVDSSQEGGEGV